MTCVLPTNEITIMLCKYMNKSAEHAQHDSPALSRLKRMLFHPQLAKCPMKAQDDFLQGKRETYAQNENSGESCFINFAVGFCSDRQKCLPCVAVHNLLTFITFQLSIDQASKFHVQTSSLSLLSRTNVKNCLLSFYEAECCKPSF